jgi:hypothetical protein
LKSTAVKVLSVKPAESVPFDQKVAKWLTEKACSSISLSAWPDSTAFLQAEQVFGIEGYIILMRLTNVDESS